MERQVTFTAKYVDDYYVQVKTSFGLEITVKASEIETAVALLFARTFKNVFYIADGKVTLTVIQKK